MSEHWSVTVERNGENLVTIETNCLSGKPSFTDDEAQTIRDAAETLLAFIGRPRPVVTVGAVFRCDDGRMVRVSGMPDGVTVVPRSSRSRSRQGHRDEAAVVPA